MAKIFEAHMGFTTLQGCAVTLSSVPFCAQTPPIHSVGKPKALANEGAPQWKASCAIHNMTQSLSLVQVLLTSQLWIETHCRAKPLKTPVNPSETYGFLRIVAVSWQSVWWIWGVALSLCGFPCPNLRPTRGSLSEDMIQHTTWL